MVNYDLPIKNDFPYDPDYELYLHRIGRSGRFGRKGEMNLREAKGEMIYLIGFC